MESAFPFVANNPSEKGQVIETGMTLRDYFAAQYMKNAGFEQMDPWEADPGRFARRCYEVADAMLEARKK